MILSYDIIIPIYNGFEFLAPLFESIKKGTTVSHRIIVIHDCSTDSRVNDFLNAISDYKNSFCLDIKIIRNDTNMGFVKSINLGFTFVQHDFVILNSDTRVPIGWLERLMAPLRADKAIASVTPLTNSGTICSFPRWLEDNTLAFDLSLDEIDGVIKSQHDYTYVETPTGVGFCMAMSKKVVDDIGLFDDVTFQLGYGEENDWCMRALTASYKHVIIKNLFVYHKHGGSFGERKKELAAQGLQKLKERYPFYERIVETFIRSNPFSSFFATTSVLVFLKQNPDIIFSHSLGGGANDFIFEYLCDDIASTYVILITGSGDVEDNIQFLKNKELLFKTTIKDLGNILALLDNADVRSFHLNHLVSFYNIPASLDLLISFLKKQKGKVFFYLHDYFSLCPSINLLNHQGIYCGIPSDTFACNQCLSKMKNSLCKISIQSWRSYFRNLLEATDVIYSFSASTTSMFKAVFPEMEFKIKHYQLKTLNLGRRRVMNFSGKRRLRLGILGVVSRHKGLEIIEKISFLVKKFSLPFDITIIGYATSKIYGVKQTGKYIKHDLHDTIRMYEIDYFLLPSICPETYCYTADEIMELDYPIICFNLGAPAERVAKYGHGYLVDYISAEFMLVKVIEVAEKYSLNVRIDEKRKAKLTEVGRFYWFYYVLVFARKGSSFLKRLLKRLFQPLRSYFFYFEKTATKYFKRH